MTHDHLYTFKYNESISEFIQQISEPLLNNFGISLLTYRKFTNEGQLLYIFNNKLWMNYSFENICWNSVSFKQRLSTLTSQRSLNYVWPVNPDINDPVYCALKGHNIWNGIIMYKKFPEYIEAFAFAGNVDQYKLRNFYVNNINILDEFITYFKNKAHSFLDPCDKKIYIPYPIDDLLKEQLPEEKIKMFLNQTEIKKFYIMINDKEVGFTKRELECIHYLSTGKTIKEASRIIGLSPRTLESYMDNAKLKANIHSKNKLIESYLLVKNRIPNFSFNT
jgi:DNA-binding CsgD family transcriptional regulator